MEIITPILTILVIMIFFVLAALVHLIKGKNNPSDNQETFDVRLREIQETLNTRLHESNKMVSDQMRQQFESSKRQMEHQFESSKKQVEDITREITQVKEIGRGMLSFTDQLQSLEKTLKNPQRRGVVGEHMLEQVIANVLPPETYSIQHSFKNGMRADAVIFLRDKKIISIDAKFSLDNYTKLLSGESEDVTAIEQRLRDDIKMRIQETAKYIIPKEGTLDYAFMFIPSESLYYDLLTQKIGSNNAAENMLEYAFNKHRVIIVSPTTLLAYLQTVNLGLRSLQIEERAQEIMKQVRMLDKRLESHMKAFHGVGRALGTAVNHYNEAEKKYDLIDKDVFKIAGTGGEYSRELLNKPHSTEND